MASKPSLSPAQATRVRGAALWTGAMAVLYAKVSALYFYKDFFQFVREDGDLALGPQGLGVHLEGPIWSVLSLFRVGGAALAVGLLSLSALSLWRGTPRARVLTLVTLWGVVLPQVLWYTEYLNDWHNGQNLGATLLAALGAVGVPTALLWGRKLARKFEGRDMLTGWGALTEGRERLIAAAIALGWLGFAGSSFVDFSYRLPSGLAYAGALGAVGASALGVWGILRMKAWGLWAGVAAALSLAMVPLASLWTPYLPNIGWHLDSAVATLASNAPMKLLWAAFPMALVWGIANPFLKGFLRKLTGADDEAAATDFYYSATGVTHTSAQQAHEGAAHESHEQAHAAEAEASAPAFERVEVRANLAP